MRIDIGFSEWTNTSVVGGLIYIGNSTPNNLMTQLSAYTFHATEKFVSIRDEDTCVAEL